MPVGTVIWYAASTAPDGFLECNGQSTASYTALAALVGAVVPDLRGEFVRGWDHGRGVDTGRIFGSWQSDSLKSHSHTITMPFSSWGGFSMTGGGLYHPTQEGVTVGNTNLFGSTETRARNISLLPCIKY